MRCDELEPTERVQAHEPQYFRLARDEDRSALECILERGEVRDIHDSIVMQAAELVESREAGVRFTREGLLAAANALLGPRPCDYGTWVHFPWSGQLVHVLPEAEFSEVRTSRNRNKITRAEQAVLGRLRIGIVGLSVGQATAVTLALEGIGGHFRLADFDTLALSNLNRLRAGVHELEQNKAILTARRIFELNPYATIELFAGGVTEDNIGAFMGEEQKLDLLFEECDDLSMKVRLREEARRLGIPVLMETNDRGLLDVERFDREPDRPLFHGLAGQLDSRSLRDLTAYEKVPTVLAIVGDISPRGAASLLDVESTLRGWPQLASAVALGSALNTHAARRIALEQFRESGRFYVDLDQLIGDGASTDVAKISAHAAPSSDVAAGYDSRSLEPLESGPLGETELFKIVTWAALAPSGGNAQPWRFAYRQKAGKLEFWLAPERATSSLDFAHRGSLVALGAAVENARLAATTLGRQVAIELSPADDENRVAVMQFEQSRRTMLGDEDDARLSLSVEARATRRSSNDEEPLSDEMAASLSAFVEESGGRLDLITDRDRLASLGESIATGDKLRLLHPLLHDELVSELRWSELEAISTRDGLDLRSLELSPTDIAAMRLLRSSEVLKELREVGGGEGLKRGARKAVSHAAAVGLLRKPGRRTRRAYLDGGRVMQRLWLWAEANGMGLHPMTGFLYWFEPMTALHERLAHFDAAGAGFSASETRELLELRSDFLAHFPPLEAAEILFFRLVRTRASVLRSLRRPVAQLLTIV